MYALLVVSTALVPSPFFQGSGIHQWNFRGSPTSGSVEKRLQSVKIHPMVHFKAPFALMTPCPGPHGALPTACGAVYAIRHPFLHGIPLHVLWLRTAGAHGFPCLPSGGRRRVHSFGVWHGTETRCPEPVPYGTQFALLFVSIPHVGEVMWCLLRWQARPRRPFCAHLRVWSGVLTSFPCACP